MNWRPCCTARQGSGHLTQSIEKLHDARTQARTENSSQKNKVAASTLLLDRKVVAKRRMWGIVFQHVRENAQRRTVAPLLQA